MFLQVVMVVMVVVHQSRSIVLFVQFVLLVARLLKLLDNASSSWCSVLGGAAWLFFVIFGGVARCVRD